MSDCLQHTVPHCNTLQHTATHCNTTTGVQNAHSASTLRALLHKWLIETHCNQLQHTATRDNTLQHTATHCNTLQHTATHCNAGVWNAHNLFGLRAQRYKWLTEAHYYPLQHAATHRRNTLQHTATQVFGMRTVFLDYAHYSINGETSERIDGKWLSYHGKSTVLCCNALAAPQRCVCGCTYTHTHMCAGTYGVATISRLLKIIGLFCRI